MTYDPLGDGYPVWSPDGSRIVFSSQRHNGPSNLYVRSADLVGSEQRLTTSTNDQRPFSWAQDGNLMVFHELRPETRLDIGVVGVDGDRTSRIIVSGRSDEARPAVSTDGRWIAYQSNQSGRWEVYVQPFPDLNGLWQVSADGGTSPIWGPGGRELFYRNESKMMRVATDLAGKTFRYGSPQILFEAAYVPEAATGADGQSYALEARRPAARH